MKRVLVGAAVVAAGMLGTAAPPASACDPTVPSCAGTLVVQTLYTAERTVTNAIWGPLNDLGIYCAGPYPIC